MNQTDDGDFDDFFERIEPMTPAEQRETLLVYFVVLLDGLDEGSIQVMRNHCLLRFPASAERDKLIETIDSSLAR